MTTVQMTFDEFQAIVKVQFRVTGPLPFSRTEIRIGRHWAEVPGRPLSVYYQFAERRWAVVAKWPMNIFGVGLTLEEACEDFRRKVLCDRNKVCERHDRLLEALP